ESKGNDLSRVDESPERNFLPPVGGSIRGERAPYDVLDVARKGSGGRNPAQRRLGPCTPDRLEGAPALEGCKQAGRDLRVACIEREHRVGQEFVPGTVRPIELGV